MKSTNTYRHLKVRGSLDAASISVGEKFTLPTEDGELGQIMITDGDGTITWQSVSDLSLTTDDVTEGSNLYFTIERVDNQIVTLIQDGKGLNWTYNNASNAFTGNVTLAPFDTDDLNEGASNLYFTDSRVNDRVSNLIQDGTGITWVYDVNSGELTPTISLSAFNTGDLSEGSNLYFTVERAQDATAALIQDGTGISWIYKDIANTLTPTITLAPFDTDDLTEGETNLYFTGERVDDRVSTLVKDTATVTWRYSNNGNLPGTLEADAAAIVDIHKNGSFVAAYNTINFIEGSGINLNFTNDAANSKVDITITSTGSEIESGTMRAVLSSGLLIGDPDIIALNFLEGFTITESPNRQINIDIDLLLDELSDVVLTSPILDGDTLVYDSNSGIWTNSQSSSMTLIERSLPDLRTDIANNALVPGATYKITGVHKAHTVDGTHISALYDDGRDLGTTVFLKAISENELETFGSGVFYNPKYEMQLYGVEIWDANKSYGVNDVVFWGGYAWKNLTGVTGHALPIPNTHPSLENILGRPLFLDSKNWEKIPYTDETYYTRVIDKIEYDLKDDLILGRFDLENNIKVRVDKQSLYSKPTFDEDLRYVEFVNWISLVPFGVGGGYDDSTVNFYGQTNNEISQFVGFIDLINIPYTSGCLNNKVSRKSIVTRNSLDNSNIQNNNLENSGIDGSTLESAHIEDNFLYNSHMGGNTLYSSSIGNNRLCNSAIVDISLEGGSRMYNNNLVNSHVVNLNLNSISHFSNNQMINFHANFGNITYTGKEIVGVHFEGLEEFAYFIPDLTGATIIFDSSLTQRKVFDAGGGVLKIQYWDSVNNEFAIADITD